MRNLQMVKYIKESLVASTPGADFAKHFIPLNLDCGEKKIIRLFFFIEIQIQWKFQFALISILIQCLL